jgi:hypothetical protein
MSVQIFGNFEPIFAVPIAAKYFSDEKPFSLADEVLFSLVWQFSETPRLHWIVAAVSFRCFLSCRQFGSGNDQQVSCNDLRLKNLPSFVLTKIFQTPVEARINVLTT